MAGKKGGVWPQVRSRFLKSWFAIRSSYWFVPILMAVTAIPWAFGLAYLDMLWGIQEFVESLVGPLRWLLGTTPASVRSLLETIAGGMISIATVSYSMTLIVLTLASSQYGPRILSIFVEDRANQVVLGTLVSLTIYCFVLLSFVGEPDTGQTVPQLSVVVAFIWALVNLGAFIFFFHHVVESIRAPEIIEHIGKELRKRISSLPEETEGYEGAEDRAEALRRLDDIPHFRLLAKESGYVQVIDFDRLAQLAKNQEITFCMLHRAGDWIIEGAPLVVVYGLGEDAQAVDEGLESEIRLAFVVGDRRTPTQDFSFGIYQLEEIAVRALSPSTNDPHTAINCINQLGSLLAYLARVYSPNSVRVGENGRPLLIRQITSYAELLDAAFTDIRLYGADQTAVVNSLMDTIKTLMTLVHTAEQRAALQIQAEMIARSALEKATLEEDRESIRDRLDAVLELVGPTSA
jgi:uncharacterized membrane protein